MARSLRQMVVRGLRSRPESRRPVSLRVEGPGRRHDGYGRRVSRDRETGSARRHREVRRSLVRGRCDRHDDVCREGRQDDTHDDGPLRFERSSRRRPEVADGRRRCEKLRQPRRAAEGAEGLKSIAAVFLGFLAVVVLSLGTDEVLHVLHVYGPWNQPMTDPGLNLLALSYRIVFTVVGGYVTARLAPRAPMRHVWILAIIGLIAGIGGVFAGMQMHMGPLWYPIGIAVTAVPCTLLGGAISQRGRVREG